jgi:hypothetical protein
MGRKKDNVPNSTHCPRGGYRPLKEFTIAWRTYDIVAKGSSPVLQFCSCPFPNLQIFKSTNQQIFKSTNQQIIKSINHQINNVLQLL